MPELNSRRQDDAKHMSAHSGPSTHLSLLLRLKDASDSPAWNDAWSEFLLVYRPIVVRWCRARMPDVDADDVAQEILVSLLRNMQKFEYDPEQSFYKWLRTVTSHATTDHYRAVKRRAKVGQTNVDAVHDEASYEPVEEEMAELIYSDYLPRAEQQARSRFSKKHWECYQSVEHRGENAADVGTRMKMKRATVHQAVFRIRRIVRKEIKKLLDGDGIDSP